MKTDQHWLSIAVPIIAVVIASINQWALELFRLKRQKSQASPYAGKSPTYKRNIGQRWRFWVNVFYVVLILYSIYQLVILVMLPSGKPNKDALLISLNVGEISYMMVMLVLNVIIHQIDRIVTIIERIVDELLSNSKLSGDTAKALKDFQDQFSSSKRKKLKQK